MAQRSREELLSLFPDIADGIRKLEQTGGTAQTGPRPAIRPKSPPRPKLVKKVKGRGRYTGYTTVNWPGLAQTPMKWEDVDESRVVVSSGRKRRKGHKRPIRG